MLRGRKVVIHDIFTGMSIEIDSINGACRWFYENNISKSPKGALSNVQRSLSNKCVIYKAYYLTFKEDNQS